MAAAAAAAIVQAGVGIYTQLAAGNITKQQADMLKLQLAKASGIALPELEKMVATQLPPSAVAALKTDTGLRSNQEESLAALKEIINGGGMALDDQVAQEAALSRSAGATRRSRAGLAQNLASRGQLNSGAMLEMGLDAEQQNANSARQSGMEAAAMAQRRKFDALRELGSQSGQLRAQDRAEASEAARASDDRERWNATGREKAAYYNAGLPQQNFVNQMTQVSGQAPAANNLAAHYGQEAQGVRNMGAGIGAASAQAVKSIGDSADRPNTYEWESDSYSHKLERDPDEEPG